MTDRADSLLFADHVIPVLPRGQVLENAAVSIKNGRISALLTAAEAAAVEAEEVIHLPGHALLPGLVNMHGHAAMIGKSPRRKAATSRPASKAGRQPVTESTEKRPPIPG